MNRRQVLAHLGAGTVLGLSGCQTSVGSEATTTETASEPLDSQPCPPYSIEQYRAVCSHTADSDTEPVYLEAEPATSPLDDGRPATEITLTVHNNSDTERRFNPASWTVSYREENEWTELEQDVVGDGLAVIPANEALSLPLQSVINSLEAYPDLRPGLYAVERAFPRPEPSHGVSDPAASVEIVPCIALVRLGATA